MLRDLETALLPAADPLPASHHEGHAAPGFRVHTRALLEKNWTLKRHRWAGRKIQKCPCCCNRPCCFPMGCFCEILFPLLVLMPLCYQAYQCIHPTYPGDSCIDINIGGWGGYAQNGATTCNEPDPGPNDPYNPSAASCSTWNSQAAQVGSFLGVMLQLQAAGLKLAWVTTAAADRPKLDKMIAWLSQHWYPGFSDTLPEGCYDPLIQNIVQTSSVLGYDQYDKYQNNYPPTPTPCRVSREKLGNFEQLQMPSLKTEADLDRYLKHYSFEEASAPDGPGLLWGAVVFNKLEVNGDGSPGAPGDWEYTIRLNSTNYGYGVSTSGAVVTLNGCQGYGLGCPGPGNRNGYSANTGFMAMQLLIDRYILGLENLDLDQTRADSLAKNMERDLNPSSGQWPRDLPFGVIENVSNIIAKPLTYGPETVVSVPLPAADTQVNTLFGQNSIMTFCGLFFVIAFLFTMYGVVAELILEKQTKIRESLKMMGVETAALFASFFLLHAMVFGVLCLAISMYLTILPGGYALLPLSSTLVVFVFLWLWCMAFVAFAFAFHTFWNRAMAGGMVAALVMLGQSIVYMLHIYCSSTVLCPESL